MRFSTTLTLAAAVLGAEAHRFNEHYGQRFGGGHRFSATAAVPTFSTVTKPSAVSTTVAATTTTAAAATTTTAAAATTTTVAAATTTTAAPATTSVASSSSSSSLTSDEQGALDAQNSARSDVGTAALVWDADLAAEAQAYAETLAASGTFEHSGVEDEGENLYMGYDSTPFTSAADAWIDEKSSYSDQVISSTNYMTFGHYTQIVWSDTTNVGMGSAKGSDGAVYVVARYSPPGNYIGEKAY